MAAVIGTIWPIVQATVASNKLSAVLLADETPGRPDLDAMKMSGLSLFFAENEIPVPKSVGHRIVRSLGESWAVGQIGGEGDLLVSGAALVGSDSLITGDTQGRLGKLNLNTGDFDWMRNVAGHPITAVEPARGSSAIGLADSEGTIYLTDHDGGVLWSAKAPGAVESIRASSNAVLIVTTDGTAYTRAGDQNDWIRHPAHNVLDAQLSPTSGGHVLSRDGSDLVVWDISGLRTRTWALPATEFETASLDPTAHQLVAIGPGSQLWTALDGSPLRPTGIVTPDVVRELAITEAGTVVWATDALGAQVFDAVHALSLGRICPSSTGEMLAVTVDNDSGRVVCVNGATATVQDITDLLPRDSVPVNLGLSERKSFTSDGNAQTADKADSPGAGSARGATVEILSDGRVKFEFDGSSEILDPRASTFSGDSRPRGTTPDGKVDSLFDPGTLWFSGEPTVVSVNSTGTTAAVGSSDGTVTELDFKAGGPALASRWTVPGQSPITQLGWSQEGDSLVVGTNRREWFTPPSCAGCGTDLAKLLSAVNRRGWFCYPKEAVELFTESAAKALGIRQCAVPSVQAQQ